MLIDKKDIPKMIKAINTNYSTAKKLFEKLMKRKIMIDPLKKRLWKIIDDIQDYNNKKHTTKETEQFYNEKRIERNALKARIEEDMYIDKTTAQEMLKELDKIKAKIKAKLNYKRNIEHKHTKVKKGKSWKLIKS